MAYLFYIPLLAASAWLLCLLDSIASICTLSAELCEQTVFVMFYFLSHSANLKVACNAAHDFSMAAFW